MTTEKAYLGIVTLAIAVISERIAVKWYYIGGYNGLINVPPLSIAGWEILNLMMIPVILVAMFTLMSRRSRAEIVGGSPEPMN